MDASQKAVGSTLARVDENGKDRVISNFSKKLSPEEQNYTVNDREHLGLIHFLERLRCYLEESEFKMVTDNQVVKHLFSIPRLCRR